MASTVLCVRVSSHKMALYSGSPVTLSHTIVVSLWRNKERALIRSKIKSDVRSSKT